MKTIKTIIKESPVANLANPYKYAVACLFSGIMVTIVSLAIFMFNNIEHVGTSFNF